MTENQKKRLKPLLKKLMMEVKNELRESTYLDDKFDNSQPIQKLLQISSKKRIGPGSKMYDFLENLYEYESSWDAFRKYMQEKGFKVEDISNGYVIMPIEGK